MSKEKFFSKIIQSLEENELYEIAIHYLKIVDDLNKIIKTNGPWDSGIDLKNISTTEFEIQYQATVQEKNFEKKLFNDIEQARKNCDNYILPNKVKYFYSYPLSTTTILELKSQAKQKHNIVLDLVEANAITQVAIAFFEFGKKLVSMSDIKEYYENEDFFNNDKCKTFFDLMTFGASTDIKFNVIKSFIINLLCSGNGGVEKETVLNELNTNFKSKITKPYFDSVLNRLKTEKAIDVKDDKLSITEKERQKVTEILEKSKLDEAIVRNEISSFLEQYSISEYTEEIILKLINVFESKYSINLSEFTLRETNIDDFNTATKKVSEYISSIISGEYDANTIALNLINIADSNDIFHRIAAGQAYSKVSDIDRLQCYINTNINNKDIFLDTNVILHALCHSYCPNSDYDNFYYKTSKLFIEYAQKNKLKLKTIRRYAREITNNFKEAFSLIPFTKLQYFQYLGSSSNVLLNFYLYLRDNEQLPDGTNSFEQFINDFGFKYNKIDIEDTYKSETENLLDNLNIDIEEIEKKYQTGKVVDIINDDLKKNLRYKPHHAILSDAIMISRLGDRDTDLNPVDPIFCSWDLTLIRVRKKYFEEFPSCTKWFIYTPTRLIDHFSMMNFKIGQGSLSNEVLTILDVNYQFQIHTQSLLDAMLVIINPNNEVGLHYANKLAEMRNNDILQISKKQDEQFQQAFDKSGIDIIFNTLFIKAYNQGPDYFTNFKGIFTKKEIFDDIIQLFEKELLFFNDNNRISDNLFDNIDKYVEK